MATSLLPLEKQLAKQAHDLILSDFTIYDSVRVLADKVSTSPYTLKRIFKIAYGVSITSFSMTARIEEAKRLLHRTSYTHDAIATMVGYADAPNFQSSFKKVVGKTPGEWRREQEAPE